MLKHVLKSAKSRASSCSGPSRHPICGTAESGSSIKYKNINACCMSGSSNFKAIDNYRNSRKLLYFTFVVALGAFTDAYTQFTVSASTFSLIASFHSVSALSASLALFFVGSFIGAVTWGRAVDFFGRRLIFMLNLALLAALVILSALSTNLIEFFIFRFAIGVVIGGDYPAAMSLLSEYSPRKIRGKLSSVFWMIFLSGQTSAYVVGYVFDVYYGITPMMWRIVVASAAIPALVGLILRANLPESARWLISKGKVDQAYSSIAKFTGTTKNTSEELVSVKPKTAHWWNIFQGQYIGVTLGIFCATFFMNMAGATIGTEFPYILGQFGFSHAKSLLGTILTSNIALLVGSLTVILLSDKLSRVWLFMTGALGGGVVILLLILIDHHIYLLLTAVTIYEFLVAFWFFVGVSWGAELYPTSLRGLGSGFGVSMNRLGAAVATYATPILFISLGTNNTFGLYGVLDLIGTAGAFALLYRRGQAQGKSLEESSAEAS